MGLWADGALALLWAAAALAAPGLATPLVGVLGVVGLGAVGLAAAGRAGRLVAAALAAGGGLLLGHGLALAPAPADAGWLLTSAGACVVAPLLAGVAALWGARRRAAAAGGPPASPLGRELLVAAVGTLALVVATPPALVPLGVHLDLAAVWPPVAGAAGGLCGGLGAWSLLAVAERRRLVLSGLALAALAALALAVGAPRLPLQAPARLAFPARGASAR